MVDDVLIKKALKPAINSNKKIKLMAIWSRYKEICQRHNTMYRPWPVFVSVINKTDTVKIMGDVPENAFVVKNENKQNTI